MKSLVFISRVTLFYNGCMLLTMVMRFFNWVPVSTVQSTLVVEGFFLSIIMNGLLSVWCIILLIKRRPLSSFRPVWLVVMNFLCFIFQLYLILK